MFVLFSSAISKIIEEFGERKYYDYLINKQGFSRIEYEEAA